MFNNRDYILTIVEQGTLSQAATHLHLSQPALSIAVKKLEATLGQPIFDRTTSPFTLTPAGELYVTKARQVDAIEQSLTNELDNLDHHLTGHLTIGGAFISVTYLLPPVLKQFHDAYPQVQISLLETPFPALPRLLLNQQIDLVVDTDLFLNPKITSVRLFENHVLLAVPDQFVPANIRQQYGYDYDQIVANHHLRTNAPMVDLAQFASLPFVLMTPSNEIYQRTAPLFMTANFKPTVAIVVNQQVSGYEFAQRNWGAAFVTDTLIKNQHQITGLHYYRLTGVEQPRYVSASFRDQGYQSPVLHKFIAFAQDFYRTH